MKRSVVWILLSYSVLGLTGIPVGAQGTRPEKETLVVEPGNDFRAALEKGVRLKAVGQPITAKLLEPVYAGEVLAIPAGSTIKGHVSAISTAPMRKRARRLLNGDFTPPKTAHVTFDQLVLSDGTTVPIHSDSAVGLGRVANSRYLPKAQRPGMRQKLKGATAPLREPNKLQRLGEAVVTSLPYHPEYIDQGTVFDTALLEPVTLLAPVQPNTASQQASDYLHLHLLTPVNSSTSTAGTQIEAVVSQPYYQADHQLLYPAGTRITGTVQKASSAGWMKRNGSIVFAFRSVQMPDGTTRDIHSTVGGIQAERSEGLDVGKEGEIKATTSTVRAASRSRFTCRPIESSCGHDSAEDGMVSVRRRPERLRLARCRRSAGICRHGNWFRILWRRKETLRRIHHERFKRRTAGKYSDFSATGLR